MGGIATLHRVILHVMTTSNVGKKMPERARHEASPISTALRAWQNYVVVLMELIVGGKLHPGTLHIPIGVLFVADP